MYRITCDGLSLLDTRDDELILDSPRVKTEVNTVGEGSFTIYANHPNYNALHPLKSVVEVSDEFGVIFRGRVTEDTKDFHNRKAVDLEGAMAFFNDSVVRPYSFPDDFKEDANYKAAAESGNVVAFYLWWLIEQHNAQVEPFQQFKLGTVTVADPNNNITRSETEMPSTWDELKAKLFGSSLGGYLCIRYEADGNYIDYLAEFTEKNEQGISFGENMLDITQNTDGNETYSAIIPRGAEVERKDSSGEDYEGMYGTISSTVTVKDRLTIKDLPDGDITNDIVKKGDTLYSKKAVAAYGWRYAPRDNTLWEDVTDAKNLQTKGVKYLEGDAVKLPNTITVTAADLHYSDKQIRSFRIYKKIPVDSSAHDISGDFDLTALDVDILNPQNTKITVGKTVFSLTALQSKQQSSVKNILNNYATTQQVASGLNAAEKLIETKVEQSETDILLQVSSTYATKDELRETAASITITDDQIVAAVSGTFATKDELGNYATTETVDNKISVAIDGIDLSVYATKDDLYSVEGQLALEIVTAEDGSKYSQLRADVDKVVFNAGQFAVNSNSLIIDTSADNPYFKFTPTLNDYIEMSKEGLRTSFMESNGDLYTHSYGASPYITMQTNMFSGNTHLGRVNIGHIAGSILDGTPYAWFGMDTNDYLKFKAGIKGYLNGTWESDAAISTSSDRNIKHDIGTLPEAYSTAFDNLRPCRFKYDNGTSDRYHIGFIAQEVEDAVVSAGLTTEDFAAVCYDTDSGNKINYSVRYTEIVALNTCEIQKLKKRIAELETLLKER